MSAARIVFTTERGEPLLRGKLPASAELVVASSERVSTRAVVDALKARGARAILTEDGPSLLGELIAENALDELFLTTSPLLFGRSPNDRRKSLVNGVDLAGRELELMSLRRQGSYSFARYRVTGT